MKWRKLKDERGKESPYAIVSSCGNYRVSKQVCGNRMVYTAWHNKVALIYTESADKAKEVCDEHGH